MKLPMLRQAMVLTIGILTACSTAATTADPPSTTTSPTTVLETTAAPSVVTEPGTAAPTVAPSTTPPATSPSVVVVTEPATYTSANLEIHLRFVSEITGFTSQQLEEIAMPILNDPAGWNQAGFTFVADPASTLAVVLAEGPRVDTLCLPLDTYSTVSCQNGAVVALNADRWRRGTDDWDGTLEEYRRYLVTHEVGHLIGLRHPVERCPDDTAIAAVMEPQTNGLADEGCIGNGTPLEWEIDWARTRPSVVGPDPDWDGPRPTWPDG